MNVELPYGESTLRAALPERTRTLRNTEAATLPPVEDLDTVVREALARPLELPRLGELVRPGASVTVAFDDATVASYGPIRGIAIKAVTRFADDYARRPEYVEAYRHGYAFHPVHAIMALYPLKRLQHLGRVIVAAPRDPAVPRHLGFETASSVEEAVARAEAVHGRECAIAHVQQPTAPRL